MYSNDEKVICIPYCYIRMSEDTTITFGAKRFEVQLTRFGDLKFPKKCNKNATAR